jgi:hypothetical protein
MQHRRHFSLFRFTFILSILLFTSFTFSPPQPAQAAPVVLLGNLPANNDNAYVPINWNLFSQFPFNPSLPAYAIVFATTGGASNPISQIAFRFQNPNPSFLGPFSGDHEIGVGIYAEDTSTPHPRPGNLVIALSSIKISPQSPSKIFYATAPPNSFLQGGRRYWLMLSDVTSPSPYGEPIRWLASSPPINPTGVFTIDSVRMASGGSTWQPIALRPSFEILSLPSAGDVTPPTIQNVTLLDQNPSSPNAVVRFRFNFSEPVTGLDFNDFGLMGTNNFPLSPPMITSIDVSGSTATIGVRPTPYSLGVTTLGIRLTGSGTDLAGNLIGGTPYTSPVQYTINTALSGNRPTVDVTSTAPNPTTSATIPITITFSEAVSGFTLSDLVITNGTPSLMAGSGTTYNLNVTASAFGDVTVSIPEAAAQTGAGQLNLASSTLTRSYVSSDTSSPHVWLTQIEGPLTTNASTVKFNWYFTEPITGLDASDFTIQGSGTLSGATIASIDTSNAYNAYITVNTGTGNGELGMLLTGSATDLSGNPLVGIPHSFWPRYTIDKTPPQVANLTCYASNPTSAPRIPCTVTFTERVSLLGITHASRFVVTNGTADNSAEVPGTNKTVYTFELLPAAAGQVSVSYRAGYAIDSGGNTLPSASNTVTLQYVPDTTPPTVTLSSSAPNPTNANPIPFGVTFSEPVSNFVAADLVVTNGSVTNFSGGGSIYSFGVIPTAPGLVTVNLPASVAQDGGSNGNTAAAAISRTYQTIINLLQNGSFSTAGTGSNPPLHWVVYGLPSNPPWSLTGGVFTFHRAVSSTQGVIYQTVNTPLSANQTLEAEFSLGNTSSARKRVLVLIHDGDFSDSAACTFWLPAGTALRTYRMKLSTSESWSAPTFSVYASNPADGLAALQLDNASLYTLPGTFKGTVCTDPGTPNPPGGADGANLLDNSSFTAPLNPATALNAWASVNQINAQLVGGVAQLYRTGTPRGNLIQQDATVTNAGMPLEVTFQMGNSHTQRMRVVVLMHKANFGDLGVCTFWLAPNTPLQNYTLRTVATIAWTDGTALSFYPDTLYNPAPTGRVLVDNVSLRQRPGLDVAGTECYAPGQSVPAALDAAADMAPTLIPTATVNPMLPPGELPLLATPIPLQPAESISDGEGQLTEDGLGE